MCVCVCVFVYNLSPLVLGRMIWAAGAVAAMSSITFPAVSALLSRSADPDKQGEPPCALCALFSTRPPCPSLLSLFLSPFYHPLLSPVFYSPIPFINSSLSLSLHLPSAPQAWHRA